MNVVIVESMFGMFIGEDVSSVFSTKLLNPYRIFENEEGVNFISLGAGLAEVDKISIKNVLYKKTAASKTIEEYKAALKKDQEA